VEVTTREFGRDAAGLRRLAARTGVHVIATSGHVSEEYWRGVLELDRMSEEAMFEEFVHELTVGIDDTGVRAGIMKAGSSRNEITAVEARVFKAAAAAQRATGAPITTHTTAGTAALDQVRLLERCGARLDRVCIGHVDRRLVWDEHLELARSGVYLGYDCVSKEQYEPDVQRARFIVQLTEAGYGDRICVSGDLARRSYLTSWDGAPGYRYILEEFLPLLRRHGLSERAATALVEENPARFLTWSEEDDVD
jgi:phosphotriesterase-related protein